MYLEHHGIKGMKWGVWNEETAARYNGGSVGRYSRNYQSPFKTELKSPRIYRIGSIKTPAAKRYEKEEAKRREYFSQMKRKEAKNTSKEVQSILDSMSKDDLYLLAISDPKKYVKAEDFVKRFVEKDENNIPVSFIDFQNDHGSLNVVIGTRSGEQYRSKGYATKVAKKGLDWVDKNGKYLTTPYEYVVWSAYAQNTKSRNLAEKLGFEPEYDYSQYEDWDDTYYIKKIK